MSMTEDMKKKIQEGVREGQTKRVEEIEKLKQNARNQKTETEKRIEVLKHLEEVEEYIDYLLLEDVFMDMAWESKKKYRELLSIMKAMWSKER